MKVLISAAEASSDLHGAELLRALRSEAREKNIEIDAFGIGGPKLQAEGLRPIADASSLMAMGFSELLGRFPKILKALRLLTQAAEKENPDIAVMIDYPEFHFKLAPRLRRLGIPLVYYIPPKVWVWRKKRLQFLKANFNKILCIFPFEEGFYRDAQVSQAVYIGNPVIEELPLKKSKAQARADLDIPQDSLVTILMPGSRPAELKFHTTVMLSAAFESAKSLNRKMTVLMPLPLIANVESTLQRVREFQAATPDYLSFLDIRVSRGDSAECMLAADAGLIKSGTSTLEAGLLGCPHAVVYKPSFITEWIYKLFIRYGGPVGLVNLVAGIKAGDPYVAKEILLDQVTVPNLHAELLALLSDPARRLEITEGFKKIRTALKAHEKPSGNAAREILAVLPTREAQ
ncbi:lipid-A-disaccharide synthase [bacterium]|nr:lipid-A-disaccharide synthase [bacterium]